ncbi:phosphodiesterase [Nonomuraea rubra]|uniref:phosphodiesterase n=1 Tax=Nonomuraea rubra TaxID=46180 RepID=UPI0031F104DD
MRYLDTIPGDLDAVLVTGEHRRPDGRRRSTRRAAKLLASRHPVLVGSGQPRRQCGSSAAPCWARSRRTARSTMSWRTSRAVYAMFDSSIPGRDDGPPDDETLACAGRRAGRQRGPAGVRAFHHPPVKLHTKPPVDGSGCTRPAAGGSARRRAGVPAVLAGTAHTAAAHHVRRQPTAGRRGVVSTLTMPWEGGDELRHCVDFTPA